MSLTFCEEKHEYRVAGKIVPGVTDILKSEVPPTGDSWLMQRGSAVHKALELLDAGTLDASTIDPRVMPFIQAYKDFLRDMHPVEIRREWRVHSKRYGYAGTLDRIWLIGGVRVVVDFKTGSIIPGYVGPQTAAYLQAARESGEKVDGRRVLRLCPTGNYKWRECRGIDDWARFERALDAWKGKNDARRD